MSERPKSKPKKTTKKAGSKAKDKPRAKRPFHVRLRRIFWRIVAVVFLVMVGSTALYSVVNPPTAPYMFSESRRLGGITKDWVAIEDIAPVMARSVVAAEDANFCLHWGLDVRAIQAALETSGSGGASTISQQVVKNVFLWHGRSWFRKSLEAVWTPLMELLWTKERILEVYLNVAEFDEGVFGIQAASRHYFGVDASDLSANQAARLAVVLPAPKSRSAVDPTPELSRRANGIVDGAATILADGRASCFEG